MVYTLTDHRNDAIECSKLCSETTCLWLVVPLEFWTFYDVISLVYKSVDLGGRRIIKKKKKPIIIIFEINNTWNWLNLHVCVQRENSNWLFITSFQGPSASAYITYVKEEVGGCY